MLAFMKITAQPGIWARKKQEDIEWAIAYQLGIFAEAWGGKLGNYPAILKKSAWFLQL